MIIEGENVNKFAALSTRARIEIEIKGMKFRGRSTTAVVKDMIGCKSRSKKAVLKAYEEHIINKVFQPTMAIVEHPTENRFVVVKSGELGFFDPIHEISKDQAKAFNASHGVLPWMHSYLIEQSMFGWKYENTNKHIEKSRVGA
jgi:hypothetical protein